MSRFKPGKIAVILMTGILMNAGVKAQLYISENTFTTKNNSLVFVNGDVVYAGDLIQTIEHQGELELKGNWYNLSTQDKKTFTNTSQGIVIMSGALQSFNGLNTRFPNLTLAGSGKKIQYTDIQIAYILDLTDRQLDVNGNIASVLSARSNAIVYNQGGYINTSFNNKGWLLRSTEKDTLYVYPLGDVHNAYYRFRPLIIKPATAGNVYGQFQDYNPGQDRLSVSAMSADLSRVNPLYYHALRTDSIVPINVQVQYPCSIADDGHYGTMASWNTQRGLWEKLTSLGPVPTAAYVTDDNLFYANNLMLNSATLPIDLANEKSNGPDLKIPNVITPNGNGKNDYFVIVGLEHFPNSEIAIVNRWGHEVYRSQNYDNKWNAYGLNAGTYYYVLKLRQPDGSIIPYKGYIEVIKK